ncbi:MAG: response regulator [Polyangiaceae bacterium]|nr:response regulator [Polyangiaceae bacterium]
MTPYSQRSRNILEYPSRILLVEDSPVERGLYRRMLDGSAYPAEVIEADSAEMALEICRVEPPDCAIVDYHLPQMTGVQFLEALQTPMGIPPVAVIILTGSDDAEIPYLAMQAGARDFLRKGGITAKSLLRAIEQSLEKRGPRRMLMLEEAYRYGFVAYVGEEREPSSEGLAAMLSASELDTLWAAVSRSLSVSTARSA